MAEHLIRFDDADAYERGMGPWSRLAGQAFLEWLEPPAGLRWLDVGCGTGAFTELIVERHAPLEMQGIDPSEAQLAVARARLGARGAAFLEGDAMPLPFKPARFDVPSWRSSSSSFPILRKPSPKWLGWFGPADLLRPKGGICSAAGSPSTRLRRARRASPRCSRQARAPGAWTRFAPCGRAQGFRP